MKRITMLLGAGIMILSSMVYAAVPQLINFQGVVKDSAGNTPAVDMLGLTFTIYDAPLGGSVLWTETQSVTIVAGGLFSVLLGASNPIPDSVFADSSRWLGIQVETDPEMTPRQQMVSVAYSLRAADFIPNYGTQNTFIGKNAGNLTMFGPGGNTATGDSAFSSNSQGSYNTATGVHALASNTAGSLNTASGAFALAASIASFNNAASGFNALRNNTAGNGNTASGAYALFSNTTGTDNTACGRSANYTNTTGNRNTAIGAAASVLTGNRPTPRSSEPTQP